MKKIYVLLFIFSCSAISSEYQGCDEAQLFGINLAGAGFASNKIPGVYGTDYQFPSESHFAYYSGAGFNAVRLSIIWERLQPVLLGELNSEYLAHIEEMLIYAEKYGVKLILDLHNYQRYEGRLIINDKAGRDAFRDIWVRIPQALKAYSSLYGYGLMNEPHDTEGTWHKLAQVGVEAIRTVDKKRVIYVAGDGWSNAHRWPQVNPDVFIDDPYSNIKYESHVYFDSDFSGRYKDVEWWPSDVLERVDNRLMPFLRWLEVKKVHGVIGEFGVPSDDEDWLVMLDRFLFLSDKYCLDWFYWAGGQWSDKYELSLEPRNGKPRLPLKKIRKYISKK